MLANTWHKPCLHNKELWARGLHLDANIFGWTLEIPWWSIVKIKKGTIWKFILQIKIMPPFKTNIHNWLKTHHKVFWQWGSDKYWILNTSRTFATQKWLLHWLVFIHDYMFCKVVNDYYGQQKRVQKYPYNAHNHAVEYC